MNSAISTTAIAGLAILLLGCGDGVFAPLPVVDAGPVESAGSPPPPLPQPPPAAPPPKLGPYPACVLDEDCGGTAAGECQRPACVAGKCTAVAAAKGTACNGGLCDGACVPHLAVVCAAGGQTHVGCDGTLRSLLKYEGPDGTGYCGSTSEDLGYCAPGNYCAALVAGAWVPGKCQALVPCSACDESPVKGACSRQFCDFSSGTCDAIDFDSGTPCGPLCVGGGPQVACGACDGAGACQ